MFEKEEDLCHPLIYLLSHWRIQFYFIFFSFQDSIEIQWFIIGALLSAVWRGQANLILVELILRK